MIALTLYAPDANTLTALAHRYGFLPGVKLAIERRRADRRNPKLARPHARDERHGERRQVPILRGSFALTEQP